MTGSGFWRIHFVPGFDATLAGPVFVHFDHAAETVGVLLGEVVEFGAVFGHVVHFPGLVVFGDDFEGALAEGAVALVFPSGDGAGAEGLAAEGGCEGASGERGERGAVALGGVLGAGEVEHGGDNVDDVGGVVVEGAGIGDLVAPCGDERGGDAAFVDPGLKHAEGGIGGVGPGAAVAGEGVGGAGDGGFRGFFEATADIGAFVTASVIGEEEDEGIIEAAGLLEGVEDAADALVHGIDHGGVNGHPEVPFLAFFLGQGIPGGDFGVAGGEGPAFVDEAGGGEPFVAFGAELVPSFHVLAAILLDVLGEGMEGPVGGGVGEIEGEGFVFRGFADHAGGVIGEGVGHVEALFWRRIWLVIEGHFAPGIEAEEVGGAGDEAEVLVEAAVEGPMGPILADVPFAGHHDGIAGGFKGFGHGLAVLVEVALIGGDTAVVHHVADAGLVGVEAGEEGGAGGAAAGGIIELGEADAALGEAVEVGSRDFAAIAADVGEAHVVGHDDEEIGAWAGLGEGGRGGGEEAGEVAAGQRHGFTLYQSWAC